MESNLLNQPLHLPNGSVLRNRLAKAAMSETLGTYDNRPTNGLVQLYRRWSTSDPRPAESGLAAFLKSALGSSWGTFRTRRLRARA